MTPILGQSLVVWYKQDIHQAESIVYAPQSVAPDQPSPPRAVHPAKWSAIKAAVDRLARAVHELHDKAAYADPRGAGGIEDAARALGFEILPPQGFVSLLQPGFHPRLDVSGDEMANIPWEAIEERYRICPACGFRTDPWNPAHAETRYCSRDAAVMNAAGGRLVTQYHLTFAVPGEGRCADAGRRFLIVADPLEDLCRVREGRAGVCHRHIEGIRGLLDAAGFDVRLLRGKQARADIVLKALQDPELMGVYYFGHGAFTPNRREASLLLADRPLGAGEIRTMAPTAPFVFLNACEAAASPERQGGPELPTSLAAVFAAGGSSKAVIAPLWPMLSPSAAEAALAFFSGRSGQTPLAETLRSVRRESLARYEAGEPNLCWMAYRYFGDPNATLVPRQATAAPITSATAASREGPPSRQFDAQDRLRRECFDFDLDDILLRALKRQFIHARDVLDSADLMAGLLRKGELTRHLVRLAGHDPEQAYARLAAPDTRDAVRTDTADGATTARQLDVTDITAISERLTHPTRAAFAAPVIEVLHRAEQRAAMRPTDAGISLVTEEDLLLALLDEPDWDTRAPHAALPTAARMRTLAGARDAAKIDCNGRVTLTRLDPRARDVVLRAHTLAQQRGVNPIGFRVLLAAFLANADGVAGKACQQAGSVMPPERLARLLRATIEDNTPTSFNFGTDACSRSVTPMLDEAYRRTPPDRCVNELILFQSFCHVVPPALKHVLRHPALGVDLDRLERLGAMQQAPSPVPVVGAEGDAPPQASQPHASPATATRDIDPREFNLEAWSVIIHAAELARLRGSVNLRSPHLIAALLETTTEPVELPLMPFPDDRRKQADAVLAILPRADSLPSDCRSTPSTRVIEACRIAVTRARAAGRDEATPADLLRALTQAPGGLIDLMRHRLS